MKDSNVFFLGTQTGVRVYTGRDDQWKDAGRHISGDVGSSWREIELGALPPVRAMWIACC